MTTYNSSLALILDTFILDCKPNTKHAVEHENTGKT